MIFVNLCHTVIITFVNPFVIFHTDNHFFHTDRSFVLLTSLQFILCDVWTFSYNKGYHPCLCTYVRLCACEYDGYVVRGVDGICGDMQKNRTDEE